MSQTLGQAVTTAVGRLTEAGCADPARDVRALAAFALGLDPMQVTLEAGRVLDTTSATRLNAAVAARARRQPVAQIIGQRQFWGRAFRVTGDVLDPRPETETLIEAALGGRPADRVLDLGTGSGCLAITLAAEWRGCEVLGTDLSDAALAVARENAATLSVAERVQFVQGPWFAPVTGSFDLIVSNPPYISATEMAELAPDVAQWEPAMALSPGGDGLDAYRAIATGLRAHLAPGGRALLEFGLGQGGAIQAIFAAQGWLNTSSIVDMTGRPRVLFVEDRQNAVDLPI